MSKENDHSPAILREEHIKSDIELELRKQFMSLKSDGSMFDLLFRLGGIYPIAYDADEWVEIDGDFSIPLLSAGNYEVKGKHDPAAYGKMFTVMFKGQNTARIYDSVRDSKDMIELYSHIRKVGSW